MFAFLFFTGLICIKLGRFNFCI
ncbi:Rcs stress response system protein RcsF, partial [Klebsiella pneumoniae]|nr:Rcs stress response system protein RcsF [Klebsiella pneumoniae]